MFNYYSKIFETRSSVGEPEPGAGDLFFFRVSQSRYGDIRKMYRILYIKIFLIENLREFPRLKREVETERR